MGTTVSYLLMLQKYINSKQENLKQKKDPLCLVNISENFSANCIKNRIKWVCVRAFDISDITNIHKYLMANQKNFCYFFT